MSELFFTFDYIAVHLRNNIKKEDNNISNGNTIWATRATNTLLCRDGIRAIVVGQVVATDMLSSTYRLVWTRSVILHAIFHSMLSGRHCAGIVSVACLLVWNQPLCIRMSSILLLCTKKMPILLFSPADGSCQDTWEHGSDITVVSCGAECAGPAWARRHQWSCLFSIVYIL